MKTRLPFNRLCLTPIATAVCLLSPIQSAFAQATTPPASVAAANDGSTLGTVQVTARRRLETQFDVPAAMTAISGADLQAAGITDIQGIIGMVPNANMTENPKGFDTYISIRGMRQADVGAEANFGMYRNGIYAGGHRVNLGSQVDVSRFEIVRGPQGGLYGRDAVGGAANIIYAMPTPGDERRGYATISLENMGRTRFEGAITTPINDNVATRTTVWAINQTGGEYYNTTLNEQIDANSDKGLRFSAAANVSPAVSLLGTFEYQKASGPSLRAYAPNGIANGGIGPFPAVISPSETPGTIQRDTPNRNDIEQVYAAGKMTYIASTGTLTLMASARDYKLAGIQDQDMTALALSAGPLVLKQMLNRKEAIRQYYAEALWESPQDRPLTWRSGISYFKETFGIDQAFATTLDSGKIGFIGIPNLGVIGGAAGIPNPGSSNGVNSISAFADLRYELNKQLAMTATLRYSQDKESLNWSQGIDASSHPVASMLFSGVVPTFTLNQENTYSFLSPSVGMEYKFNPDTNMYAIYSTGYRPGGYNTSVTNAAFIPYGQESAENFEAGVKMRLLDGRAGLNFTVFRMNQKDLTVQQDDPTDTKFGFSYLSNAGSATTNGFELESMARLSKSLGASFSVGYLDAKYTQGTINAGTVGAFDVTGRELSGVRPWTLNAKLDFKQQVSGSTEFFGAIGVRREIGGAIGDHSEIPMEALTKIDLNAGLNFSKKTQLTAFIHNSTYQQVTLFRFTNGAVGTNIGRRFGIQLTHQY